MILSIHQPHFFPWLGYFHKIIQGDCFVYLDNVQYRKNYFQNRTMIKDLSGESYWFTIPVQKAPLNTSIKEIKIADVFQADKLIRTLQTFYHKTPYFSELAPLVFEIIRNNSGSLNSINFRSIKLVMDLLSINKPFYIASELGIINDDPNGRIVEICHKLNANQYLAGKGGKNYMDLDLFRKENIDVLWQEFVPSNYAYSQINGVFIPGLSVLDVLFNIGTENTKKLLAL